MADRLKLTVVSPERALVDAEADEVQVPGLNGYFGIRPGHAALFSELMIGRLSYTQGSRTESLALAGGFVEVLDNQVRVLATVAESPEDIDPTRARDALGRAQALLKGDADETDYDRALRAERRAQSRIEVAEGSD